MKRKIAAILAADVASYSRLVSEDEEETLARLRSYRTVFADFIERFRGHIFNTAGDAILAEFESAVDAVRCAIDIQETLRSRNLAYPPSRQMKFRVGITIGDVVEQEGDLLGDGVNIAARLEGIAPEGGICISRSVYEAAANKLAVEFADRGKQNLKNIPEPVHAYTFASVASSGKGKRNPTNLPLLVTSAAGAAAVAAGVAFFLLQPEHVERRSSSSIVAQGDVSPKQVAIEPPNAREKPASDEVLAPTKQAASVDTTTASEIPTSPQILDSPPSEPVAPARKPRPSEVAASDVSSNNAALQPAQPAISDELAMQANLRRQWSGCRSGDGLDAVVKACSELIRSNIYSGPELASVYIELGRVQRDNRLADEAIKSYSEAIRISPSAKAFNDRGIAHYDKGQWAEAIDDYSEAIRLDPTNGEAFNNRAWTKLKAGRIQVALEDANEAVRLLPSKAFAIDTRAHVYEALGNRDAAIQDYRKALELSPDNNGSLQGLRRLGSTF